MPNRDFDLIVNEIAGHFSVFQILVLVCVVWLGSYTFFSTQILQSVFTAHKQDYICKPHNSTNFVYNSSLPKCDQPDVNDSRLSTPCTEWIFDQTEFQSTIRSQFNLTCDREWLVSLPPTCLMLGFFFSNYIFGAISDRYGRHVSGCVASIVGSIGAFGAAFVPEFWMFCLMRGLVGVGIGGLSLTAASFSVEVCVASMRINYMMFFMNTFSVSGFVLTFLGYLIRNHIHLQLICASFGLIYLFMPLIIPESPRWLLSKGYNDRAFNACKRIAKINGKPFTRERFDHLCSLIKTDSHLKNVSLLKILTRPNLRTVTFVLWWSFAVASFVYYILSLGSGSLGVNVYLNMTLMFISDIIVRAVNLYLGIKFGRVPCLVVTYFGAGVFILLCGPVYRVPGMENLVTAFSLIGRSFIGMAFDMIWMYAADIYPTIARSSGVGSGSSLARIGSLVSPQLDNLTKIWVPLPFIISGAVPIIASALCWIYLPETARMPTMDYLDSTENYIQKNKRKICSKSCLCFHAAIQPDEIELNGLECLPEKEALNA